MLSVSYAGKNAYSAGKTSGVLRGGASGANRYYVLAHPGGGGTLGSDVTLRKNRSVFIQCRTMPVGAGKNAYSAGKTSGVLRGGASGANRCYVLAHCGRGVNLNLDNVCKYTVFFLTAPLNHHF